MPIFDDIVDHDLLGPAIRQGFEAGFAKGFEEGRLQGMRQATRTSIEERFGTLPIPMQGRFASLTCAELNTVVDRLFDAKTVEELFAGE